MLDLGAIKLQTAILVQLHEHVVDNVRRFHFSRGGLVVLVRLGWMVRQKPILEFILLQDIIFSFLIPAA